MGAPSFPSDPAGKGRWAGWAHCPGAERKLNKVELLREPREAAEKGLLLLRPKDGPQVGFVGAAGNSSIT